MSSPQIPTLHGTNGSSHGKLEKRAVSTDLERPSSDNSLKKPVRRLSSSSSSSSLQKSVRSVAPQPKAPPTSPHASSNPSGPVYSFPSETLPLHHKFEPNISFPHCLSFSHSRSLAATPDLVSLGEDETEPDEPPRLIKAKSMYDLSIRAMAEVDEDSTESASLSSAGDSESLSSIDNMERSNTPLESRIKEFERMHFDDDDCDEMQPGSTTKINANSPPSSEELIKQTDPNSATEPEKLEDL